MCKSCKVISVCVCVCIFLCVSVPPSVQPGFFPMTSLLKHGAHSWMEIPLAQCVYHILAPQPSRTHTHTHTFTQARTHAILLGAGSAARKPEGTNYSSLLFLSLPRQPHKTALQISRPPRFKSACPHRPSWSRCGGVCSCWVNE